MHTLIWPLRVYAAQYNNLSSCTRCKLNGFILKQVQCLKICAVQPLPTLLLPQATVRAPPPPSLVGKTQRQLPRQFARRFSSPHKHPLALAQNTFRSSSLLNFTTSNIQKQILKKTRTICDAFFHCSPFDLVILQNAFAVTNLN